MSLLLMVLALLGALVVLGGGGLVLDRLLRELDGRRGPPAAGPGASGPVGSGEGGYTVLEGAEWDGAHAPPLVPAPTLARVRELLALGRGVEAVRVMRDETGMDQNAARDAVEHVRRGRLG